MFVSVLLDDWISSGGVLLQKLITFEEEIAARNEVAEHQQTGYRHYPIVVGGLLVSEALSKDVINLPMHPYLGEARQPASLPRRGTR